MQCGMGTSALEPAEMLSRQLGHKEQLLSYLRRAEGKNWVLSPGPGKLRIQLVLYRPMPVPPVCAAGTSAAPAPANLRGYGPEPSGSHLWQLLLCASVRKTRQQNPKYPSPAFLSPPVMQEDK